MHPNEQYGKQVMEMLQSLNMAVEAAGGSLMSLESLKRMTVEEFILGLASNNVRFTFIKDKPSGV